VSGEQNSTVQRVDADRLLRLGKAMLCGAGAAEQEAEVVAEELVESSLMGLDSHGVMRLAQYVTQMLEGTLKPNVTPRIVKETPSSVIVDGGMGFGMVTARFMTHEAARRARERGMAAAASQRTHHVGRLGSFPQRLAQEGLFGLAVASASRQGHYVTPWGGTRGRLGTNPFAYGFPTGGDPIVLDMSTSVIAEGSIRVAKQKGAQLPPGCILDPEGRPSVNPEDFYRDAWGAILPFGGPQGYKGFGLSLLVELLGSAMAGVALTPEGERDPYINGFFVLAIDPDAFCGREALRRLVDETAAYIRSAPLADGAGAIMLPGEREWRTRRERLAQGVPVAKGTWEALAAAAAKVGVQV